MKMPANRSSNNALADSRYGNPSLWDKFTGKERDVETGYNWFGPGRYYDSWAARWLQVDPLKDKYPGWSSYNYCKDDPINKFDPNGKYVKEPSNPDVLKAQITAYRESTTYRNLHNDILNNKKVIWNIDVANKSGSVS